MKISIPKPLFDKMLSGVQCSNISEGYVDKTFFHQNKEIVITGSMGSGSLGNSQVWGHHIVDIERYKDSLVPLNNDDHYCAVNEGKRERGYKGQKSKFGKRTIVFIGEKVTFVPMNSDVQLELFS